jgi:ADP-ribose pyrophosphatase YjhB (NUDIX family)
VARTEHYNDPSAPLANSIVPAVTAVVVNDAGNILLQKRTDNGLWALPGGAMDIGESISQTVVREVKEETGLDVEPTRIVGIYTNPRHVIEYSNGEVRQQFSICFAARVHGGSLAVSDESTDLRFVAPEDLDQLHIHESMRLRIQHFLERRTTPYIG